MIDYAESCERIDALGMRTATERVPLDQAAGHCLAQPLLAQLDSPRQDVSAMDGYAVRDADIERLPACLAVTGTSYPGKSCHKTLAAGECLRIFTGAPIPLSADRVVLQEEMRREGDFVVLERAVGSARHVRARGSDFVAGTILLDAGKRLDARSMVVAAATDLPEVDIYRRPRVLVIGTGDELVSPGTARAYEASIPQSVSYGVCAMAEEWGAACQGHLLVPDEIHEMRQVADAALADVDVVVVTGGASVGERDFGRAMFETFGLHEIFVKVAIKPGKPVWLGQARDTVVLGLPGNPTSALVTARLYLAPLILKVSGGDPALARRWKTVALAGDLPATGPRETFVRAAWEGERARPLTDQGSGSQRALAAADLLLRRPPATPALASGDFVQALEF